MSKHLSLSDRAMIERLLTLDFTDNNKLCGIALLSPSGASSDTAAAEISGTSEPVSAEASAKPSFAKV